ncbi:MAG: hypothetical protein IJT49_07535 [Clostridia bacterium]|nr:hypothetical protein [Clostridia bacterium]
MSFKKLLSVFIAATIVFTPLFSVCVFAGAETPASQRAGSAEPEITAETDVSEKASAAVTALTVLAVFLFAVIAATSVLLIVMIKKNAAKK